MPANLTPQQQQEMAKYQARLREVNDKLQIVEREAARVDSLPRGHRERSPSPPPGKVLPTTSFCKYWPNSYIPMYNRSSDGRQLYRLL
jgi:uncharacterized coiled-coil protein SlyX